MEVQLITDADAFAGLVHDFLAADPFSTSVLGGVLSGIRRGDREQPTGTVWICVQDSGVAAGAAMHTPPFPVFLPRLPVGAAAAIAENLLAAGHLVPGATGETTTVTEFSDRWCSLTGSSARQVMASRMYRLGRLVPPTGVPGAARVAGPDDLELVAEWFELFRREAIPESPAEESGVIAARRIRNGDIWLWAVGGALVSLAAGSAPVAGVARVAPVYTPIAARRRGFGAAVTAQATRACLRAGASEVVLYTDLGNPTSNAIYQQIGYRPHHDARELHFVD